MTERLVLHLALHFGGLLLSMFAGSWLVSRLLHRLRLLNTDGKGPGPQQAGTLIGVAERFLIYVMVVMGQPQLLAALVAIKTVVRYPESL